MQPLRPRSRCGSADWASSTSWWSRSRRKATCGPGIKARFPEPKPQLEPAITLPEFNLELEPEPEPKEERAAELELPSPFEPTPTPEPASGPADESATPSAEHVSENGKAAEAPPPDIIELPSWEPAA